MERPTGISIIAIAYIILALLSILWSGLIFGIGGLTALFGGLVGAENMAAVGTSGGWTGFLGIIVAIVQFIVGFGLWYMKKWAWILALVGAMLTIVEGIVGMLSGGPFAFMCGILGLAIPVIILIYLSLASTRQAFGIGTPGTQAPPGT